MDQPQLDKAAWSSGIDAERIAQAVERALEQHSSWIKKPTVEAPDPTQTTEFFVDPVGCIDDAVTTLWFVHLRTMQQQRRQFAVVAESKNDGSIRVASLRHVQLRPRVIWGPDALIVAEEYLGREVQAVRRVRDLVYAARWRGRFEQDGRGWLIRECRAIGVELTIVASDGRSTVTVSVNRGLEFPDLVVTALDVDWSSR